MNKEKYGKAVDAKCRNLTAPWVRAQKESQMRGIGDAEEEVKVCDFFEVFGVEESTDLKVLQNLENETKSHAIATGVYSLEDMKQFGEEKGLCPYFLARKMVGVN